MAQKKHQILSHFSDKSLFSPMEIAINNRMLSQIIPLKRLQITFSILFQYSYPIFKFKSTIHFVLPFFSEKKYKVVPQFVRVQLVYKYYFTRVDEWGLYL